jgi:flagellar L-ring protein precursor FlgH
MPVDRGVPATANSLWRQGARSFLRDQRAAEVGDIVTVLVQIGDSAALKNESSRDRTGSERAGLPNLFGLENSLRDRLRANPDSLLSINSSGAATGTGTIQRNETVLLRVAGVVSQVMPNGNLVVVGRQEVRVNSELRELQLSGVIRPQDIASDNTVRHDRMAEARISYGGRGQITDVQTPRYGQQVLDLILPF